MLADHSAKGRLRGGITIIEALRIFEEESNTALGQVLDEAAKLIEHRGRTWTAAMAGIEDALSRQIEQAPKLLDKARRVASSNREASIGVAMGERLAEIGTRLRIQLSDFQEGWSSPTPKTWKDRHPFWYAVALLAAGAVIGSAGSIITGVLTSKSGREPRVAPVSSHTASTAAAPGR